MVSVPARLIAAFEICGTTGAACGFSSFGLSRLIVATSVSRRRGGDSIFAPCCSPWVWEGTLINAQRNENIADVSTKPSSSAIGKRIVDTVYDAPARTASVVCARSRLSRSLMVAVVPTMLATGGGRRPEGDVADAGELHLVPHLRDDAGVRRLVGDDHRRILRPFDVQSL